MKYMYLLVRDAVLATLVDGILTSDALQKIRTSNDSTYFNRTSFLELLQNARESLLQKTHTRFDFDDPHGLSDEDYYNLTGLTKTQFDDLMGYVNDVRSLKSRSVRTCVVTFVTRKIIKYFQKSVKKMSKIDVLPPKWRSFSKQIAIVFTSWMYLLMWCQIITHLQLNRLLQENNIKFPEICETMSKIDVLTPK